MTSKNLCSKLMREDLKRRVWAIAWCVLSQVFALVVPTALRCSDFAERRRIMTTAENASRMANIVEHVSLNAGVMAALVITAVLWAVSGYHYLHNKKKVDFYHSLPVKRGQLFLSAYLNGILVPLACYLAALGAALICMISVGISVDGMGTWLFRSFLMNGVYYCLIYTVTVIAMMMTGHVAVAILGTGVFWCYGPAVVLLITNYCREYFYTYPYFDVGLPGIPLFSEVIYDSSPLISYVNAAVKLSDGEWNCLMALPVLLVTAALAAAAYGMYRLRASEAAGKAMAFEKTKSWIRILITIPVGVAGGLFFGLIGGGVGWTVFGCVCGAVLTHCLMEIIYHFDFRRLFAMRYQLVVSTVAALVISMAGYYDLYGYDSWYPSADEIVDASVFCNYIDSWVTYGEPKLKDTGLENSYYYWGYEEGSDYRFSHMKLTDAYTVSELVRYGAEWEKANRFSRERMSPYMTCYIRVQLKSGRELYRKYRIPENEETLELFASIENSLAYKQGMYPVLNQTAEDTAEVYFMQYNTGGEEPLALDEAGLAQLLEAFQKDMEELTVETRKKETPIGTIQFMTKEQRYALDYNAELHDENYYHYDIAARSYYPVYPSFGRTLGILESCGMNMMELNEDNIVSISVYYYDSVPAVLSDGQEGGGAENAAGETGAGGEEDAAGTEGAAVEDIPAAAVRTRAAKEENMVEYTDPEDIRALAPALIWEQYLSMDSDYFVYDTLAANVSVSIKLKVDGSRTENDREYTGEWTENLGCRMDLSKIPEETARKYGLENEREYNGKAGNY